MRIIVNTATKMFTDLDVDQMDTIGMVKKVIHDQEGVLPEHQYLYFGKVYLEDSKTLQDYNIMDGATLTLILRLRSKTQIFIKTLVPKYIPLEVDLNDTIMAVKLRIQNQEGIPPDQQCLYFNKQELEDTKTLNHYCVVKDSELCLFLRLARSQSYGNAKSSWCCTRILERLWI